MDLKVSNTICGLQTHLSMHPCTWCDVKFKCLAKSGNLRTLGSIKSSLKSFQQTGGVIANAKLFDNVIRKTIISRSNNDLFLEIIPTMELHLLLGVVNHLFKILKTAWVEDVKWPAALNIQLSPYHEGMFDGNECQQLLKNADVLQQLPDTNLVHNIFHINEAFKSFNLVVKACFGFILQPDFAERIENFTRCFLMITGASVTPKIHTVFYHIKVFISHKGFPWGPLVSKLSKLLIKIFIKIGQGISKTIIIQNTKKDYCAA